MADVAALASKVPKDWQRSLLPFIQRSAEFEQVKQPIVGFFLLQYVAHVGMKLHKTHANKAESTPFIMALLDVLESKKAKYAQEIAEVDGRTEISRTALALFTRADDDERAGVVSEAIVKLFYSASLLFEATKQFMDDDKMDPFAAEKHRYAQVVAAKMKKAIATGTPYESPSGAKEKTQGVADHDGDITGGFGDSSSAAIASPPPANTNNTAGYSYSPPAAPPSQPPPPVSSGYSYQPPALAPSVPPPQQNSYSYQPPPPPAAQPPQHQYTAPPPPPSQLQQYQPPAPTAAAPMPAAPSPVAPVNTYVPPTAPQGHYNPTPNDMIDAQKYAKLAVSALQFYDHQNARKQLILALQHLDGEAKK